MRSPITIFILLGFTLLNAQEIKRKSFSQHLGNKLFEKNILNGSNLTNRDLRWRSDFYKTKTVRNTGIIVLVGGTILSGAGLTKLHHIHLGIEDRFREPLAKGYLAIGLGSMLSGLIMIFWSADKRFKILESFLHEYDYLGYQKVEPHTQLFLNGGGLSLKHTF